jgi:hypothetical protein
MRGDVPKNGRAVEGWSPGVTWLPVQGALGWSQRSVYRFLSVYDLAQKGDFSNVGIDDLDLLSHYLLAATSTPADGCAERVDAGNVQ